MGAPKPTGIPDALNSIIAPQEEPAFLTAKRYFSHKFYRFFIRAEKGIFSNFKLFQFCLSQDIKPNCVTAPIY